MLRVSCWLHNGAPHTEQLACSFSVRQLGPRARGNKTLPTCSPSVCAGNVLLHSNTSVAHRFGAKVADFGLARDISVVSRLETRTYGTMTHMAPEVLSSDTLSKVRARGCVSPSETLLQNHYH